MTLRVFSLATASISRKRALSFASARSAMSYTSGLMSEIFMFTPNNKYFRCFSQVLFHIYFEEGNGRCCLAPLPKGRDALSKRAGGTFVAKAGSNL